MLCWFTPCTPNKELKEKGLVSGLRDPVQHRKLSWLGMDTHIQTPGALTVLNVHRN